MIQQPDICIYHGYCPDGFTSAWAIWERFGNAVDYRHGSYGAPMPTIDGKHVLLVDFSYKRPQMLDMLSRAASVTILDHHRTAYDDIGDLVENGQIMGKFDMEKSGCRLAWEWAHGDHHIPKIIQFVEDRDLWRWAVPGTKEFCAWLDLSHMEFENWHNAAKLAEDKESLQHLLAMGNILVQKHMKNCDHMIAATLHHIEIDGQRVPCCNVPHIYCSEVGNILALRDDAPFSASYYINKNGATVFSLRSVDSKEDVSKVALKFNGGGHRNASGFRVEGNHQFKVVE